MSTHNIGFYEEISKIIIIICSSVQSRKKIIDLMVVSIDEDIHMSDSIV